MTSDPATPRPHAGAAIIGAGSVGAALAAVLEQTMPVVIVESDPDRAAGILRDGVRVRGLIERDAQPIVVRSADALTAIGGIDLVFVATKTTAIPAAAESLKPILKDFARDPDGPFVISFQNGIEPGRQLRDMLGHERVLRMVLSFGAVPDNEPGKPEGAVRITLNQPPHAIGCLHDEYESACTRVAAALTQGGLETEFARDIESRVWSKGIVNAAANPIAALCNCDIAGILDAPARVLLKRLLDEGIAVAKEEGIRLPDGFRERAITLISAARDHVPSMVHDIRDGRETEIGQLNQQIIEHGKRVGVKTPTHDIIEALIETFDWRVYHHRRPASL